MVGHVGAFWRSTRILFIYLIPPVAMILAFGITGEVHNPLTVASGALILGRVMLIYFRRKAMPSSAADNRAAA